MYCFEPSRLFPEYPVIRPHNLIEFKERGGYGVGISMGSGQLYDEVGAGYCRDSRGLVRMFIAI